MIFDSCSPRSRWKSGACLAALSVPFCFIATAVQANASGGTAPAGAVASADAENEAGAIIVTARKRPELPLDVPSALTVFSTKSLENLNVKQFSDLGNTVPGLFLQQRGNFQSSVTIRGIGGDARNIGVESGVSVTVDGVTAGRTSGYNLDLARIAQVEVLKGPQGTLFGTNTIGGVINITTVKPGSDFELGANVQYGNYNSTRLSAYAVVPVTDTFSLGASVFHWTRDGYVYNSTRRIWENNVKKYGGRVQAMWRPSDDLSVYVTADKSWTPTRGLTAQIIPPYVGAVAERHPRDRYEIMGGEPDYDILHLQGASLTIDYRLPNDYTLTAISGYRNVDENVGSDQDGTPEYIGASGPYTDVSRFLTQELRIATPDSGRLHGVAGLYYQNSLAKAYHVVAVRGPISNGLGYSNWARSLTNVYAAFGNFDYDLTDHIRIGGGLRYNQEVKRGSFFQDRPSVPETSYQFPDLRRNDKAWSWNGTVTYKFNPDAALHFNVSRGFKSGGFNFDAQTALNVTPERLSFRPEHATNYELALKGNFFDRKLQLSANVFYIDYQDRQVSQFSQAPGANILTITISNAAAETSKGAEVQASLALPHSMLLDVSYAHTIAKYDSFPNATAAGASYSGNYVEYTPKDSASATLSQSLPLGIGKFVYSLNATYTGKTYMDPANNPANVQSGYVLMNARAGYEFNAGDNHSQVGVYVWARNLTNETFYILKRQYLTYNQGMYGEPRFFGMELSYKY